MNFLKLRSLYIFPNLLNSIVFMNFLVFEQHFLSARTATVTLKSIAATSST